MSEQFDRNNNNRPSMPLGPYVLSPDKNDEGANRTAHAEWSAVFMKDIKRKQTDVVDPYSCSW